MQKRDKDLDIRAQVYVSIESMLDLWDPLDLYEDDKEYGVYHQPARTIYRKCKNKAVLEISGFVWWYFYSKCKSEGARKKFASVKGKLCSKVAKKIKTNCIK